MVSVELQNIRMHAFHGIYHGEDRVGSEYELALKVHYDEKANDFTEITNTVNYAELFAIVKEIMATPTALLEKVADNIIQRIHQRYPFITEALVSIYKLEPPIAQFQGRVGVTLQKKFND